MATALLPVIARQQWRLLVRDRRLTILGLVLLLALLTAGLGGAAMHASAQAERAAATSEEARVWEMQGAANPHGAAHFGRDVYKPVSPLAVLDPALLPELGTALRLEAHAQNPARDRTIDGGSAIDRFGGLTPAAMLQLLAPLLVILAGFATFSGDGVRTILRQELSSGVSPALLMAGRLAGLGGAILLPLAALAIIAAAVLLLTGGGADAIGALLWMMLGYALYLWAFAALTLAASAAFGSARTALVLLLAFWAAAVLLVPRIAPAIAEAAAPTLSGPALEAAVTKEVREGPSGHDPQDARLARLREETMRRYSVSKIEDLPVDFGGISLFHGEALSTAIYRRYGAALYDGYDRQAAVQRKFALVSPLQALRPLSAGLAQSDQHAHRRFLEQADGYRYSLVQKLNRDIIHNRKDPETPYLTDVAAITRDQQFVARAVPLNETLQRHRADLMLLALWAIIATLLALAASRRLRKLAA